MGEIECDNCGSTNFDREIREGKTSNRTKGRHVGGQNRNVVRICRDCGRELGASGGSTGRTM